MCPEASGADFDLLALAINVDGGIMNVSTPTALGAPLGVAYVVARHLGSAADLTPCHCLPFGARRVILGRRSTSVYPGDSGRVPVYC